ncbi:unnamed protein product [Chilo suppressalis]|uniref:FP protein C-terminal domain-containing protein n=1 Tax=Chilo suppressalis TaxID=168631 RepID=A0ABN8BD79_CHISP|nr:unnamed protein product [Chilo suppressalis]
MPLKRTPPLTPTNLTPVTNTAFLTSSDPNLSTCVEKERNIKRKREELVERSDLEDFKTLMTNMFQELLDSIKEIKEQNIKLQESVDFTAVKYEETKEKMLKLEKARDEDRKHIVNLEERLEQLERQGRASSLEIRNLPRTNDETKQGLSKVVIELAKTINVPLCESDVKDIFRVNAKTSKPILVDLHSVLLKEKFLNGLKKFNKNNEDKLNTGHLNMNGPKIPIFISENLTTKMRRLFFLARELGAQDNYKYCWTSYGRVYLRKDEGAALIRIESESDICKLRNNL